MSDILKHLLTITAIFLGANMLQAKSNGDDDEPHDPYSDAMAGTRLSAVQAVELESLLERNTDDLAARKKLLGYYSKSRYTEQTSKDAMRKHVLWFIKNHPEAEITGTPFCEIHAISDPNGYAEAKKLWNDQTKAHTKDANILGHAANFLFLDNRVESESLLKQAKSLEPKNPNWSDRLAHLYALHRDKGGPAKALAEYEQAQSIDGDELSKFHRLSDLARSAYDAGQLEKAARYAEDSLQAVAKRNQHDCDGNSIHYANNVLGRIALKKGDSKHACEYLLKAGRTPGSPNLGSFGPNMSLARELLEAGERDTVLQYFDLCRKFWDSHGDTLDEWTKQVKAGQVPQFGANLDY